MKIKLTALAAAIGLFLCGCGSERSDVLINADDYHGILAVEESTSVTAAVMPPTVSETVNTDSSGASYGDTSDTPENRDESSFAEAPETSLSEETSESEEADSVSVSESEPETEPNTESDTAAAVTSVTSSVIDSSVVEFVTDEASTATAITTTETVTAETAETTTTAEETFADEPSFVFETDGSGYKALNYSEVKGVWISYLELNSVLTGKTESQFTDSIRKVFQNCAEMGLNTVFVHVRSHGDAYYKSDLYPWSKYVTGTVGQAPDFDPLEIMIREAHALDLSFQAWINPYRLCGVSDIKNVSEDYPIGRWYRTSEGERVVAEGSYYYLNPGYSESHELIAAGAKEIISRYNVDGIHIDDYFYPTTDASFDKKAFSASGYGSLAAFRKDNCTTTVKMLYKAVKDVNPTALFGIAPQGNIQNNYDYMYADVKTWCGGSGYTDYIMPQIYFGFKNNSQPYEGVLSDWQAMVSGGGVKLIPGLGVYKIGNEDSYGGTDGRYEWQNDGEIIKRQIIAAEEQPNYGGFALYSYSHVFDPDKNASAKLTEMEAVKNYIK